MNDHQHSANGVPEGHDHGTVAPPITEPAPIPIEAGALIRTMAALYAQDKAKDVQERAYQDEVEKGLRAALTAETARADAAEERAAKAEAKVRELTPAKQ